MRGATVGPRMGRFVREYGGGGRGRPTDEDADLDAGYCARPRGGEGRPQALALVQDGAAQVEEPEEVA